MVLPDLWAAYPPLEGEQTPYATRKQLEDALAGDPYLALFGAAASPSHLQLHGRLLLQLLPKYSTLQNDPDVPPGFGSSSGGGNAPMGAVPADLGALNASQVLHASNVWYDVSGMRACTASRHVSF